MKFYTIKHLTLLFLILFSIAVIASPQNRTSNDPLPSWNDQKAKLKIMRFVHEVTDKHGQHYVSTSDRIAVFDNDGTLWLEQPLYTQAIFAFDQIKALAPAHPQWKTQQPFKAILMNDKTAMRQFTVQDIEKLLAVTHSGMSVASFEKSVSAWLAHAKNPRFNRPYTQLVYQPMLELIDYLKQNGFKVYIVTGGGQEFVRAFAQRVYGIPPEQVIGSAVKTKYGYKNGVPILIKQPKVLFVDDKAGKPEAIHLFIGKQPLIAVGNSDGDRQMLEWTQHRSGPHLMILIHHDDSVREYAYGPQSKVGTFSNSLFKEAKKQGWIIVSMKNDWRIIFPSQK